MRKSHSHSSRRCPLFSRHKITMRNRVDYGFIFIHMLISIPHWSECSNNQKEGPSSTYLPQSNTLSPYTVLDSYAKLWMLCCVCICDLTSPLPCYCSADRCCPTLHSHNPCDPNLHCPYGARCHLSINVTGLFFSFSIFTPPSFPFFFALLMLVILFLDPCPFALLADGAEGLSAPELGKVSQLPLTNSICVSAGRRTWKAPLKKKKKENHTRRESGFNFRLLFGWK